MSFVDVAAKDIHSKCVTNFVRYNAGNYSSCITPDSLDSGLCRLLSARCTNITSKALSQWIRIPDNIRALDLGLAIMFYGYITPFLAVITVILNTIMIRTFSKRKLRSPTNFIICAVAVFDTLTISLPLPLYVMSYSLDGYAEYPTFGWCVYILYFGQYFPTVCHSTSVWLMVMLAVQRYVGITCPERFKFTRKYKTVWITIATVLVIMLLIHSMSLIAYELVESRVIGKQVFTASGISFVDSCYLVLRAQFHQYHAKANNWIRTIVVHILPVITLLIFNSLLLKITCNSYKYRQSLIRGNNAQHKSDRREVLRTSTMLASLCIFNLIVETPVTTIFTLFLLQSQHDLQLLDDHGMKLCMTSPNFILFLSFPANFVICYGLSHKFRQTLRGTVLKIKRYTLNSSHRDGESMNMMTNHSYTRTAHNNMDKRN